MGEGESPKLKPYRSAELFADKFQEKTQAPRGKEHSGWYEGVRGGILFWRYYNRYRDKYEEKVERERPGHKVGRPLDTFTHGHSIRQHIQLPRLSYRDALRLRPKTLRIVDSYNTPDGAIRWLIDNGAGNVNVTNFISMVPKDIRTQMSNWRSVSIKAKRAADILRKLSTIDDSYNTVDGAVRWIENHNLRRMAPSILSSLMTPETKARMSRWRYTSRASNKFEGIKEDLTRMEEFRTSVLREYPIDDPSAERRILSFLSGTNVEKQRAIELLEVAFKNADALMTQLSIARLIQPEQHEFTIESMHQLYSFAQEHFSLAPESVWIILRLKRMNILGVSGLVRRGERYERQGVSLETPPREDQKIPALEDRLGRVDPGFSRVEARLVLEKIFESGHLSQEHLEVLGDVINGRDLEDEEYQILADAIRMHPELMELLGLDEE